MSTEQKTEQKIDFFTLPVAEEEENTPDLTVKWNDPDLYAALDKGKQDASYSVEYRVPVKDLADFPIDVIEDARRELSRRVIRGIEVMEEHIRKSGLVDCNPVVYSRPDWENAGLARYSVGIERSLIKASSVSTYRVHDAFQQWIDSPDLAALTMCTPGRNPLTGGE